MSSIDQTDRELLQLLDCGARTTFADMAKALGLPNETVRYRYKRLCSRGLVVKTTALVDLWKLGYWCFKVYLKTDPSKQQELEHLVLHLQSNRNVPWVVTLAGDFRIAFMLVARDKDEFHALISEIMARFRSVISKRIISTSANLELLERQFDLSRFEGRERKILSIGSSGAERLDSVNEFILAQLCQDGRVSASRIAEEMKDYPGLERSHTKESISKRIKQLGKKGILCGYYTLLDPDVLGKKRYKLLLQCERHSPTLRDELFMLCREIPSVQVIAESIGSWDWELELEVISKEELQNSVQKLIDRFPQSLGGYHVLRILQVHKCSAVSLAYEQPIPAISANY